jgi:cell division protein FtsB
LVVGVLLLLFFLSPLLGENGLTAYFRLKAQRNSLTQEVEELRQQHEELEARIRALTEDPATLERYARERFNMRLPEEEVIEIVPEPGQPPSAP